MLANNFQSFKEKKHIKAMKTLLPRDNVYMNYAVLFMVLYTVLYIVRN